jgi:hypothetical protein
MNKKTEKLFEEFGLPNETADDFFKGLDDINKQLVTKTVKRSFMFAAIAGIAYFVTYAAFLLTLVGGSFWLFKFFFGA